ncbi:solute carrier family 22 member 7-like [Schistocerca piceifrons]|uniref:solute carrier family 22 member 7-like n=1 Tax=Schistocerca piceifrons TaxID=274613 RepID=UPI001F5FEEC5|nr:solute carrier family 22 member 7-like [Schistocerca piceifrons]
MELLAKDCEQVTAPAFEDVMEAIGARGKFQRRFNTIFTYLGATVNLMSVHLYYLAMQTPDHWCYVPGRENTGLTIDEWMNLTIPREQGTFSKCTMYNDSHTYKAANISEITCQHGWAYDNTWSSMTVPSQMNWVCSNKHIVNDIMFYSQYVAAVMGLLFGYVGDMCGRRWQQFLCLAAHMISRVVLILAPSIPMLFAVGVSLVAAASGPMLESSLSVGLELTTIKHRTTISAMACLCAGAGMMAAGLVAWIMPYWNFLFLFAALCCLALFSFFRCFPESPRWLACRGRQEEALSLVQRIAAANGTAVPPFTQRVLRNVARSKRDRKGLLSIFSSWNLLKNTTVLVIVRSVHVLTMFSLVLSVGGVSDNPFASVAAQGAAQLLGYLAVRHCASRFGRRWSAVAAPVLAAAVGSAIILLMTADASGTSITVMTIIMQFCTTASGAISNLQSLEVHPTCLRQITASVEWTAGSVDRRLPFAILSALNLLAAFAASFLPESALQRLPESLEDAALYGKGRRCTMLVGLLMAAPGLLQMTAGDVSYSHMLPCRHRAWTTKLHLDKSELLRMAETAFPQRSGQKGFISADLFLFY